MLKPNLSYRQLRIIARALISEEKLTDNQIHSKKSILNKKSLYNKIYRFADKYI